MTIESAREISLLRVMAYEGCALFLHRRKILHRFSYQILINSRNPGFIFWNHAQMTEELKSRAGVQASRHNSQEWTTSMKKPLLSIASLVTLVSILSGGSATPSSSHYKAIHIHLSNNGALPAQLGAPLFRDNAVAVDPKSLHVISKVISPSQEVDGSFHSSEGSLAIRQDSTAVGEVKDSNAQSVELFMQPDPLLLESTHGKSDENSQVRGQSRILSVDDMDTSESTAAEYFRSALESFSPFRRSIPSDSNKRNDTSEKNKAVELPIQEFKINMDQIPSFEDIQKSLATRVNEKNEDPIENNMKRKRLPLFNQSPKTVPVYHHRPPAKSSRTKTQHLPNQSFKSVVQRHIEVAPRNLDVNLQPQATHFVDFQAPNVPKSIAKIPMQSNYARPPVYQALTRSHSTPYATYNVVKATNQGVNDKTPIYRVAKSSSRPLTVNKRLKTQMKKADSDQPVSRAHNLARETYFSPYAVYSTVQPTIQRANTVSPMYDAHIPAVEAQSLPYSAAHPRREFSETVSYPAYPSLNSIHYSDPSYSSLQYQIPLPTYSHHFQVQANPHIPVVSLKNLYPNVLSQPSSSSLSTSWPNVKPSFYETPPYLRDLDNSFETGPVLSSGEISKTTSSAVKPSEEKKELPTIINHIHITERRRPSVDREFTIDSGSEDTEWVIHKPGQRNSDRGVGSAARIRLLSRKESGTREDEKYTSLANALSKEKRVPEYLSEGEYLKSFHPLMFGHRFTQALRVADDHHVPKFYLKPVGVRASPKPRSVEKNDDTVTNSDGGFFSTVMKFFGQSDSQQEKSESVEIDRHSIKDYKPIYRDKFEELIANLDNDSFDAFLTAIKVNQIFSKSFKRLRRNKGLLDSATLYNRRSDGIPEENTEELANRMVEDYVSVLFHEYPTIANQVELNKPLVFPAEGVRRELFVHPQQQISRNNMNEYIGLHNFTENLNDFSNRYSGKTRKWADYMSHLLTEQYFKSVNVSQPVRENIDLMVNGINNENSIARKEWKESFLNSDSRLNNYDIDSNIFRQNHKKIKPEHFSGEVRVQLGYNGTSGSVLHNMLSDILGNFIDFSGTTEAPSHKSVQDLVQSRNTNSHQSYKLDYYAPTHDHKKCSGRDCFDTQFRVQSSYENRQPSSSMTDSHGVLLDRLSWILKEEPEQLQAKFMEYVHQKYNNSNDQSQIVRQSNVGFMALSKENGLERANIKDKRIFQTNDNHFLKNEMDSTTMNAKEIDLLFTYLAQAYPYFWANILELYPRAQSYVTGLSNTPGGLNVPAGRVDVPALRKGYVRDIVMNGVPLRDFNAPPVKIFHSNSPYVGEGIQGGLRLRDLQITRAPMGPYTAYGSDYNVGLDHQGLGRHFNPSGINGLVRPNVHASSIHPRLNTGRLHSLTHTGLQSDFRPVSGTGYRLRNGGLKSAGKFKGRLRDSRRKKVKANMGDAHRSYSYLDDLEKNSSYEYDDYDDYEIEIRSEIHRPGDDSTKDSNLFAYENHKNYGKPDYRNLQKQKRKFKVNNNLSAKDYSDHFSMEDERTRGTWSDEHSADQSSEVQISMIQEFGKAQQHAKKQNPSYKSASSKNKPSNAARRSNKSKSDELLNNNFSKSSNDKNTDSKVIINIGYPFRSSESTTSSSIPSKSHEKDEERTTSTGFLSSLRHLFNFYNKDSGEQKKKGNAESQELIERKSNDDEESSEKRIAFSHVDPETRIHTIVTTSSDEVEDYEPSTEYRRVRKPLRLSSIRRATSRAKNLARGQRRPIPTDNVHGGSINIQKVTHAKLPKEAKKLFPLVDFEEVSFTETFLGDSTETFQTPKPLNEFDLDPLNPAKPKIMSKMTDTVPKVMTQPGTIYFNEGPMVRYETD
ncbi:hypothetical protein FHG87_007013 [Trinorchestia longiramus]|nr:hypothetical protein FHG87_007013 [Trinorchestia longiramus]